MFAGVIKVPIGGAIRVPSHRGHNRAALHVQQDLTGQMCAIGLRPLRNEARRDSASCGPCPRLPEGQQAAVDK